VKDAHGTQGQKTCITPKRWQRVRSRFRAVVRAFRLTSMDRCQIIMETKLGTGVPRRFAGILRHKRWYGDREPHFQDRRGPRLGRLPPSVAVRDQLFGVEDTIGKGYA